MSDRAKSAAVLALYGLFLIATNPRVTIFEDEASIVAAAWGPVHETIAVFAAGYGQHDHPPLSDIFLHLWLRLTGRSLPLLRLPFIAFYCLALWLLAETAHLAWNRRRTAVTLSVSCPAGYFLGRPAGWYTVAALELAAVTYFYFRWRAGGRTAHLAALTVSAVLLTYTNYFGWAFLLVLFVDLISGHAGPRVARKFLAAMVMAGVAFLPLVPVLIFDVHSKIAGGRPWFQKLVYGLYMSYSLLGSEMTAPWTWPGVIVVACGLALLGLAWRQPASRRMLLWLAAPLLLALAIGVLGWARMAIFLPWFLLLLASAVGLIKTRLATVLVAVAFAMGWLGIVTQKYAGAYRYIEPWREVTAQAVALSRPGDLILSSHPSFYFYLGYQPGWGAIQGIPPAPVAVAGRLVSPIGSWRAAIAGVGRVIYPRANLMPWDAKEERSFLEQAERDFRLELDRRLIENRGARLKRFFFPEVWQPEWRIELQVWTK